MFDRYFPKTKIKINTINYGNYSNYVTKEVKNKIKKRNKLRKLYSKFPLTYGKEFRKLRNEIVRDIRNAKKVYYRQKIKDSGSDTGKVWKTINSVLKRKVNENVINEIEFNNVNIDETDLISEAFNKYFSTVGIKLANEIVQPNITFNNYLNDIYENSFKFSRITENEILEIIRELKEGSPGIDEIPISVIKKCKYELYIPLLHMCNLSLSTGVVPDQLKLSCIVPIFKGGDKRKIINYRPISLLPSISKILEKCVFNQVCLFLEKNNILNKNQYGFRKGMSTELATADCVNYISEEIDKGNHVVAAFIDLTKAFDTVVHEILFKKLFYYGMRGTELEWFKSYFSDRQESVKVSNTESSFLPINISIPQGSTLGPLLFILYINDIINVSNKLKMYLYADDSVILMSGKDINNIICLMNEELENINKWFRVNRLTINSKKSNYIIFNKNKRIMNNQPLIINGREIERVKECRFLGVLLNESFNWKSHINYLVSKLSKMNGNFYLVRHLFNEDTLKLIYNAMIHSSITYANIVWGSTFKTHLNPLRICQKK